MFGEPTAEVAGRRGVGDPLGAQGVQIDLVVAPEFQMLQAGATSQQVVGDVQDMIRLAVGQVDLQYVEMPIDGLIQSQPFHHLMYDADPTCRDRSRLIGDFVMDVGS